MKKHEDIYKLIHEVYKNDKEALNFLLPHSEAVAEFASEIAKNVNADVDFVERAALLHDIGILKTHAPDIKCFGVEPYIRHGILGKEILENRGLAREAKVAQNHIGVGLSAKHIKESGLPLPEINMVPENLEEEIVAYADLFFSKDPKRASRKKSVEEVEKSVKKWGRESYEIFEAWHKKFGKDLDTNSDTN